MPEHTAKLKDLGEGVIGISDSVLEKQLLTGAGHPASTLLNANPASASTLHLLLQPDL